MTKYLYFTGFAEIPANVTVELGTETPPFRCRHMISDASIIWRVNGSSRLWFPAIRFGSINESGNIVSTLTIPAESQYNETVVECVAVLFNGSPPEVSPPATIIFTLTDYLPGTTHFEITSTNTPQGNTHCILLEKKLTYMAGCIVAFEISPSPLTVAVEQGAATFLCQHPQAGWRVNGILLNTATLPNISSATPNDVTILSIVIFLVYNGTTVECVAILIDGSSPQFTARVQLLIQGIMSVPSNHCCTIISLSRHSQTGGEYNPSKGLL